MTEQPASKKWVDFSDSDSSEESQPKQSQQSPARPHHKSNSPLSQTAKIRYTPSKNEIDEELDKLDDLDYNRVDEVWVDVFSQNLDYLEKQMKYLTGKAKNGGDIVRVFSTHQPERYELKVYINTAYDWIEKGYDPDDYLKITVSARNFQRTNRVRSPRSKDTGPYKQKQSQRQRVGANNKEQKKKYVDKQTGKAPESVKNQQPFSERKYTRQEAERKGESLAGFRSKLQTSKRDVKQESDLTANEEPDSRKKEERTKVVQEEPNESDLNEQLQQREKPSVSKKQEIQEYQRSQMSPVKEKQAKKEKKKGGKGKSGNPFDGMLDL